MNALWCLTMLPPLAVSAYGARKRVHSAVLFGLFGALAAGLAVSVTSLHAALEQSDNEQAARQAKWAAGVNAVHAAIEAKYDVTVEHNSYPGAMYEVWVVDGKPRTCRLGTDDLEVNAKDPVLTCVVETSELHSGGGAAR